MIQKTRSFLFSESKNLLRILVISVQVSCNKEKSQAHPTDFPWPSSMAKSVGLMLKGN